MRGMGATSLLPETKGSPLNQGRPHTIPKKFTFKKNKIIFIVVGIKLHPKIGSVQSLANGQRQTRVVTSIGGHSDRYP
jgi:hypothetical protein